MGAPDLPAFPGSGFTPYYSGSQAAISPGLQEHLVQSTVDQVLVHLQQSKEKSVKANLSDTDELDIERVSVFTDTQGVPGLLESSTETSLPVESGQTPHAQLRRDPLRGLDGKLIQTSITTRGNSFAKPKQWREVASEMLSSIKTELIRPGLNESERTRLSVMERILYAFLNDTENALAPIKDIDEDESEYWKYFTHGLMISLDADEKNTSSRRAALALRKLRVASDHLANVSRLDVRNLAFCSKVNSYGRFDEFSSYGFKPDQEVLLYVEVENFAVENKGNRYETELQGEYTIFDADGRRIANAGLPLDKQFSMNRRHDYFIAYRVFMPKKIEKGHYFMQLTIEDLKGNKSNQSTLEFWIR